MSEVIDGELPEDARRELLEAKQVLEHHGIADRLADLVGMPITASLKMLPSSAEAAVHAAIEKALTVALNVALRTLGDGGEARGRPRIFSHKLMAGITGAAGGALGGATIAAELPVSTVLILRSIADIARSEGEDLSQIDTRLACLQVFALDPGAGAGDAVDEDDAEIGYFAVRSALAKQVRDASQYIVRHGVVDTSAPPLVKLVSMIGRRFGLVVSEKIAAQAIPVIGALGGALINSYFIDHYQDLARAHFVVRRLERNYGSALIREAYAGIGSSQPEQ